MKSQTSLSGSIIGHTAATNRYTTSTKKLPIRNMVGQCAEYSIPYESRYLLQSPLSAQRKPLKKQTNNPAQIIIKERLNEIDKLTTNFQLYFNSQENKEPNIEEIKYSPRESNRIYSPRGSNVFDRLVNDANNKHTRVRLGIYSGFKKLPKSIREKSKELRIEDRLIMSQRIKSTQLSQRRAHAHILELKNMQVTSSEVGKAKWESLLDRFTTLEEAKQKLRFDKFQEKINTELKEVKEAPEINQRSKDLVKEVLEHKSQLQSDSTDNKKGVEILKRELYAVPQSTNKPKDKI
jgi:hypothetical protein